MEAQKKKRNEIRYKSDNGYEGLLYNWHRDDFTGERCYSMCVFRTSDGHEVLHAYNATPKSREELEIVVDSIGELFRMLNDSNFSAEDGE